MLDRIRAAFAGSSVDHDILEELAQHAEATYEALRADGASEADASAKIDQLIDGWRTDPAVLRRVIKRAVAIEPSADSSSLWSGAWADLLYGVRLLRTKPGYSALTILTVALGVGAVTTLFSVASSVLMRPLSWATGEGLVRVIESRGGREGRVPGTIMNGSYLAWEDAPQTIGKIGAWMTGAQTLTGAGDAVRLPVMNVTASLLELLQVQPIRGRFFTAAEARNNSKSRVVLLSEGIWEQRFGRRDDVVGQPIVLDGVPAMVVGVMPRSFRFPTGEAQMWMPFNVVPVDGPGGVKSGQIFRALARLKPGVSIAQANAEGTTRATNGADAGPVAMSLFGAKDPIQITVVDANEAATADVRPAIIILLIAAGLLFVTAVANVANMQLARSAARLRELTIRAALGAGTGRLSRQLLIENAIVGISGALIGFLLTVVLHRYMPSLLPVGFPRAEDIAIDVRVLGFAVAVAALTSIAAGVLPLLQARRLDLVRALADGAQGSAGAGRGRLATTRLLIAASQVAVTSVLIVGAVLLSRSFIARMSADRGYDPANVLTATVPFPRGYTPEQRLQARNRILERLKRRPGITHAAFSTGMPLMSAGGFTSFNFASAVRNGGDVQAEAMRRIVNPDYFGALGMRVRAGRALNETDTLGSPTAVIVNRSFVRKFLDDVPIEKAVGLSLGAVAVRGTAYKGDATIVGVSDDLQQDPMVAAEQPEIFTSIAQLNESTLNGPFILVIRTIDDPVTYVEALRTAMREEDPLLALDGLMTLEQRVGESLSRPRVYAVLLGGFALFALVIAGAGLFGVLSHSVTQRARELAVRTALGASRAVVVGVALKQMAVAIAAGLGTGLAASALLSNNLAPFIYGVSTLDWLSFGIAPAVLLIVGAIACIMPARRVAQTDPVVVLRES